MGIIILFMGIFNSYFHELQKLNCYNHVFLNYFQLLELNLKFVEISKNNQVLESRCNVFASILFFQEFQY